MYIKIYSESITGRMASLGINIRQTKKIPCPLPASVLQLKKRRQRGRDLRDQETLNITVKE